VNSAAVNAREMSHVRSAVLRAAVRDEPSPHLYAEDVFSPDTYAEILRLFPAEAGVLRRWEATGAFGNYGRRREISIAREADRFTAEQRAFWLELAALLRGAEFFAALLERFEPYARGRFGDRIDDPAFFRDDLHARSILNEHEPGYFLGPHTDRRERVFTCLFYFPERDGLDHLGTTLYRPRDPGYASDGTEHHDFALFERRETIPYRANAMLVLARSDVLFHGVHALTEQELMGSRRRGMQASFYVHNARQRAACKTTLRVTVPADVHAGAGYDVPFRLTNRAASALGSSFPYRTQLGYRWRRDDGSAETEGSVRAPLPRALGPAETYDGTMRVVAPRAPGRYVLRLSVVQEGVAWFDDIDPANGAGAHIVVTAPAAAVSAPRAPRFAMPSRRA
jgi:hypothetical protein